MTLTVFPDPRPEMIAALKLALGNRPEPYAAAAVVKARYADRDPAANLPALVVLADDGSTTPNRNAMERVVLRLTVWHGDPFTARELAALCKALLLEHFGSAVRRVAPVSGPLPANDPDTDEPIATVVVAAFTRPLAG